MAIRLKIKWQVQKWETYIAKPDKWTRIKMKKGLKLTIKQNENKKNW